MDYTTAIHNTPYAVGLQLIHSLLTFEGSPQQWRHQYEGGNLGGKRARKQLEEIRAWLKTKQQS